ncbi:MAG: TMEM14 family protein [Chlamydiota bacterium]
MKTTAAVILLYGLIILVGGILGHHEKGSMASLIAGLVCGSLLISSAWVTFKKKAWGEYAALVLIFLLDAFFTYRFVTTHKFLPTGLLSILSLGVLFLLTTIIRRRGCTTNKCR